MASSNLKKCLPLIETMAKIKDGKKRQAFLKLFEANLTRALREICHNVLQGNMTLSDDEKKTLSRFKRALRVLADPRTKKRRFRKTVVQSGRGLLPGLLMLVGSLASAAL